MKYAIYKINTDAWEAYFSETKLEENSCTIKISDACYEHLRKIKSFPCVNDGTIKNLEERIMKFGV
jgi:hypothetical protein